MAESLEYPERRFFGATIWSGDVVALGSSDLIRCTLRHLAGNQDPRCEGVYESVPASDMDAVRALIREVVGLAADGGYHQEMCPNYDAPCDCVMASLYAAFDALSPALLKSCEEQ